MSFLSAVNMDNERLIQEISLSLSYIIKNVEVWKEFGGCWVLKVNVLQLYRNKEDKRQLTLADGSSFVEGEITSHTIKMLDPPGVVTLLVRAGVGLIFSPGCLCHRPWPTYFHNLYTADTFNYSFMMSTCTILYNLVIQSVFSSNVTSHSVTF